MLKVMINNSDKWTDYINCKVRVVSGGSGAFGANNKMGHLVRPNTPSCSGGSRYEKTPRVMIKGDVWALCYGWLLEVHKREGIYDIYGNTIITKRK
jgi:hypothetical protein